jgi:hypothetical protein
LDIDHHSKSEVVMTRYGSFRRTLFVAAAMLFCGALAAGEGAGQTQAAQRAIPANLAPPEGQVLQRELLGIGAQVYTCRASAMAAAGYEWTFTAPAAVLRDDAGAIAGTHFAGPAWQANDGSKVTAEVVERAPSSDTSAIPWLLLRATPAGESGSFGGVAYIQRLDTTGGMAPAGGCDEAHAGAVVRVPYTAVYTFYGAP